MLDLNKILKNTDKKTDDLVHRIYHSIDRTMVMLEVDYKNKKFLIEKSERNNYDGNQSIQKAAKELDTEEKVKKHLGLL
jgi:hypothetical protein